MEREKLNQAAKHFAAWETINSSERMSNFYCSLGFTKGAEWLMGQPLSERLTEEEKKTLREIYGCYKQHEAVCKEKGLYEAEMIARGSTATMRDIFGKEMFESEG